MTSQNQSRLKRVEESGRGPAARFYPVVRSKRTCFAIPLTHLPPSTMAASTVASSALFAKASFGCKSLKAKASKAPRAVAPKATKVVSMAAASGEVPDMNKRNIMNLALVGALGLPGTCLVGGYALFFVPPRFVARRTITKYG
eukprot:5583287-Pyramimonas_sp.AAC.3